MVVYTQEGKYLCSKPIPHESCPLCHKTDVLQADLFLSYYRVGMIPLPFMYAGKQVAVRCGACNYQLKTWNGPWIPAEEKITSGLRSGLRDAKQQSLTLWQRIYPSSVLWLIVAAFIVFLSVVAITGWQQEASEAVTKKLLQHPQIGDIYKAGFIEKRPDSAYMASVLVKVLRIEGDTMYIVRSKNSLDSAFTEQDWAALSRDAQAFEDKEYAIDLKKFTSEKNLGAFYPMPEGLELGKVEYRDSGKLKIVERGLKSE